MSQEQQKPVTLTIPSDVVQSVLNYLAEQPYNKVSALINALVQNAKVLDAPAGEQEPPQGN